MKAMKWFVTGVTLLFIIGIWNCSKFQSPTEPTIDNTEQIQSTDSTNPTSLAKKSKQQQKRWGANRAIKWDKGGDLKIDKLFKLKVGKKSMNHKDLVELFGNVQLLDDGSLTFEFGPSGTAFYPNAILELKWDKLQKIGVTEPVVLRWYNPDTNEWELIARYEGKNGKTKHNKKESAKKEKEKAKKGKPQKVKFNKLEKKIRFSISHFSLYSIGKD